jgi:hypothetical protein
MINHSSQVEFNRKAGYIKLASLDRTYMLTHSNVDERSDWAMKMSGKYLEILEDGVRRFREESRKVEEEEKEEEGKEEGKEGEEEEGKEGEVEEGKDEEEGKDRF